MPGALGLAPATEKALVQSYAPIYVNCPPKETWIRPANGLSTKEVTWVYGRKQVVATALGSYLTRLGLEDFDVKNYTDALQQSNYSSVPTLGMAISGGGFQSAFTATGVIRALDDRLDEAKQYRTGGLLQSLTYISGLSGGSYPTVSFATNNFPTADEIIDIWRPEIDRQAVLGNSTQFAESINDIFNDIGAKYTAGFNVGVEDYLGRFWGSEFVPGPANGLGTTWSGVQNISNFRTHKMPLPIVEYAELTDDDMQFFGLQIPYYNATLVSDGEEYCREVANGWCSLRSRLSSLVLGVARLVPLRLQSGWGLRF